MANKEITLPDTLRHLLIYDAKSGDLFWRQRAVEMFPNERAAKSWNTRFANKSALTAYNTGGYKSGMILAKSYVAHRVAWAMHYGEWPSCNVDHINGDERDNRISNLRIATHSENMRNRKINKNNKSGLKGASWCKSNLKWAACICLNTKRINLGYYETKELAHAAYCDASIKLHGQFARAK